MVVFLASNINQEDIDIINEQDKPATVETKDVEMTSDTTAVAICEVRNFLKLDTLGRPGEIASKALYTIPLVKGTADGWLEWKAYSKVKSKITTEVRMNNCIMFV